MLVAPQNGEQEELLAFTFEAKYNLNIIFCHSIADAIEELGKIKAHQDALKLIKDSNPNENVETALREVADVELVVTTEFANVTDLFDFCDSEEIYIPIVMRVADKDAAVRKYADYGVVDFARESHVIEDLHAIFTSIVAQPELSGVDLLFCPVRISLLSRFSPISCDLYIRLSTKKFIKVLHAGAAFGDEETKRFKADKNQKFLYIKRENFETIYEGFKASLTDVMEDESATQAEVREAVVDAYEAIHELVHRVGLNEGVVEMAEQAVQGSLKAIGQNPTIHQIIKAFQADKTQYLSQHSLLVAEVACALAIDMGWSSDTNYLRLSTAALLHDITLGDSELAQVQSIEQLEQRNFNEQQIEKFAHTRLKPPIW